MEISGYRTIVDWEGKKSFDATHENNDNIKNQLKESPSDPYDIDVQNHYLQKDDEINQTAGTIMSYCCSGSCDTCYNTCGCEGK